MYNISLITAKDLEEIVELENLCFTSEAYSRSFFLEMFADERTIAIGIRNNGLLVGMMFAYNWVGLRRYLKIISIGVHPEHRNQGLAKEFMRIAIQLVVDYDLDRISAETRASNKAMQSVFTSFNFEVERVVKDYYTKPDEDAIRFVYIHDKK